MAYVGSQGVPEGKINEGAEIFRKWKESLKKDIDPDYEKNKQLAEIEDGKNTWLDLKKQRKIKL
jgi:hypothetical protein